uniref:Uncharacterized protein n=1 Tax=Anguilla anguilla TaxID=7936 RepID=A0A0E9WUF1_ANGAN
MFAGNTSKKFLSELSKICSRRLQFSIKACFPFAINQIVHHFKKLHIIEKLYGFRSASKNMMSPVYKTNSHNYAASESLLQTTNILSVKCLQNAI